MFEPLRGKEKFVEPYNIFKAKDVKSAVGFYKKYKYHYERFKKDFPNDAKIFDKQLIKIYPFETTFNRWLFDYCFGDVV